ncbi:MAG: 4-(cytidine 5'-diphospho)-2-C-methyl-D-erythritol kinase [Coriobacteriia bacterium]|nr:4-(cytidine 5'-diphospho)-2-C-methyl-D-erythritol kinase [Coriobacteriia bacterium]
MIQPLAITAPAKINLHLSVGPVRSDGYHEVVTVLHALALADTVTLCPAEGLSFSCDVDLGIPAEKNLAYRAAVAFAREFGPQEPLAIHLEKRIPAGAGLGGGSSDAAAVIAGMAVNARIDPADARCMSVARSLGADCPFFLAGAAALMIGRGDELAKLLPSIEVYIALVKPAAAVSTAAAYAAFDREPAPARDPEALIVALEAGDVHALASALENNMIAASSVLVPEVSDAIAWMRTVEGVLGVTMAGSGSAVFAICENADVAEKIAKTVRAQGCWGTSTTTRTAGVTVAYKEEC